MSDWIVIVVFIILIPIFLYFFARISKYWDSGDLSNTTLAILNFISVIIWTSSVSTSVFWLVNYIKLRTTSSIITMEEVKILLDIALGNTFEFFALHIAASIFMIVFLPSYLLQDLFPKLSKILAFLGILIIGLGLFIYISVGIKDMFAGTCQLMGMYKPFESFLFGDSPTLDSLFLSCKGAGFFTIADDVYTHPVKISLAYKHFSFIFSTWGISPAASKTLAILLPIISLVADVIAIVGFVEAKKKKT